MPGLARVLRRMGEMVSLTQRRGGYMCDCGSYRTWNPLGDLCTPYDLMSNDTLKLFHLLFSLSSPPPHFTKLSSYPWRNELVLDTRSNWHK